jgi:hypothetical protein
LLARSRLRKIESTTTVHVEAWVPQRDVLPRSGGARLSRRLRNAGALRTAIQSVLESPSIRAPAQKLADEIAAMPTIESAVDQLLEMT